DYYCMTWYNNISVF
nr:immunoglobulin light chain junction region [Macaca mulatta]MOX69123.1 immunoglobulin light chain junction region [Macaca mulatta]MOX69204.1 immunoglobulin light chain junction region [Macaca mulatta]MOX69507.1 immunoglobulin light chain junction region [Macaca mulatta]MOX69582.1 immunoglobulin light chain junction region [Macaca mulatta]